jgi:hypothetical protein
MVVAGASLFAGHGHLPRLDGHPDHGGVKGGCSICSLGHHPSVAVSAPRGWFVEDRTVDPKSERQVPRASVPVADEQAPRAPPRSAIS